MLDNSNDNVTNDSVRENLRSQYELSDESLTSVDTEDDDVVNKVSECANCVLQYNLSFFIRIEHLLPTTVYHECL